MNNDKRIRRKKRLQQKKKRQQSYGQKKRLTESQRQKGKCIRWIEPEGKNHILFVGGNSNGTICDSHTTEKQIDYLRSKESLLWRNDRLVAIDKIIIEARNHVSMEQHKAEYGAVLPPFLFAYKAMHNIHPEKLKNDFHELYLSEIQQMFLLDYIRLDREMRCNNKTPMADRPPVAVVTIENDSIVRLEFYKGHNVLTKQVDLRSRSLSEQNIPKLHR